MNRNSRSFKLLALATTTAKADETNFFSKDLDNPEVTVLRDISNQNIVNVSFQNNNHNEPCEVLETLRFECEEARKALQINEHLEPPNKINLKCSPDAVSSEFVNKDVISNNENIDTSSITDSDLMADINDTCATECREDENSEQNENSRIGLDHQDTPSSSDEEQVNTGQKRKKKRFSDPGTWKYNVIKKKREEGLEYLGRRGNDFKVEKNKRVLQKRCCCKRENTRVQCFKLDEETRSNIFEKIWKLSWPEKKLYVTARVLKVKPKRARNRKQEGESKRSSSYQYFLDKEFERVRVCKTMFCNTIGISMRTITDWLQKEVTGSADIQRTKEDDSNRETNKTRLQERKMAMKKFFDELSKLESHYCRKSSTKLYLEPHFKTKSALYSLYKNDWCIHNNVEPLSTASFSNLFDECNLSLFSPKKDECDVCVGYKTKNISESLYQEHLLKKAEAREEKAMDKNSNNKIFTMDLQSVLLCPKSYVSALYYRTKLIVHNFTIFDLHTKDGHCFLWHEGEGELIANCFSSIITHFLNNDVIPNLEDSQTIILYSDGCSAQNRNCVLSNALLNLSVHKQVCIEQKYLEKGHTQMECDSMHSTIERQLKRRIINVPADYVHICISARKNPRPYIIPFLKIFRS